MRSTSSAAGPCVSATASWGAPKSWRNMSC
uniref:Uncharacterized protein n=1 Tax=Anguilla anguilla TaxID=7936 RepID=A0A0E9UYX7_ANGAN